MEKILYVNACVRPESRTRELAETVLDCLEGSIEEINLEQENIQPLTGQSLDRRNSLLETGESDAPELKYAKQFSEADVIVFAAPYWDLSFPASVKAYIEAVNVCGITFRYTEEGIPVGLCRAKRLIYVTTAGGPVIEPNMGYAYIRGLAQMFHGIEKAEYYKAENLDTYGADVDGIMAAAKAQIKENVIWGR